MSDDFVARYLNLQRLHQELASLYTTKSKDSGRIDLLWKAIEEQEALLKLDGIDVA